MENLLQGIPGEYVCISNIIRWKTEAVHIGIYDLTQECWNVAEKFYAAKSGTKHNKE